MRQNATPPKLSAAQRKALPLLLSGFSVDSVADTCRVHRSTVYRWLANDDFKEAYRLASEEVFGQGLNQLRAAFTAATGTITAYAHEIDAVDGERLRNCLRIVREGLRAWGTEHTIREAEELNEQLRRLERRAGAAAVGAGEENGNGSSHLDFWGGGPFGR